MADLRKQIDVTKTTKRCASCGSEKPLTDFHADKRKPDGKRSRCKACTCADQRAFQHEHKDRTGEYATRKYRYECVCVVCGVAWQAVTPKARYCSIGCANTGRSYALTCESCGNVWVAKQVTARWCSYTCERAARFTTAVQLWRPQPRWARLKPPPVYRERCWYAGRCRRCDTAFVSDQPENMYCSRACGRSDGKARRRARKKNAYVADVYRAKIFERDDWVCQLCHLAVDRCAVVPHPKAPVLDHITPLAAGGTHEPANVQCAHFLCNSIKGARVEGQLPLAG
jgi:hypothetical protein